jgi:hypothetical protein
MSEPQTVRDRVRQIQRSLRDEALTPAMTRDALITLTALLGNVLDESRAADAAYAQTLMNSYKREEKANRAKLMAETTPEYARSREAQDTEKLVVEMIRSCKVYLKSLDTEMGLAR